jgi:Zn-dependent metalloprotease
MKNFIGRLLLAGALLATSTQCLAQTKVPREGRGVADATAVALARLRNESTTSVQVSYTENRLRFAAFDVQPEAPADARPAERALAFLEQHADLYGFPQAPRDTFFVSRVVENASGTHVFFDQRIGDTAVFGGQLAVHLDGTHVVSTNGDYLTALPASAASRVDAQRAIEIANKDVGSDLRVVGAPRLSYFDWRLIEQPVTGEGRGKASTTTPTQLAWRLSIVNGKENRGFDYFIDADSGAVLARFPTDLNVKDIWIRTANNFGAAPFCNFAMPTDWFTEAGVVPGAAPDAEGFAAFASTNTIYDFYLNNFGRRSWNGNDNQIRHNLDDLQSAGNAFFDGFCGHMKFGNGMSVLDVMAHEFTHGVVQTTAGLGTSFQGGALNESYGDIFGALIDTKDWTIGETLPSGNFIRSLANPPLRSSTLTIGCGPLPPFTACASSLPTAFAHPDRMSAFIANATNDSAGDFGAVHANTGIPNKAAFLIGAGGTHNGITVTGIGRAKLGNLYHEVLSSRLTNNATFSQAAAATITAASNAALTGRFGFTRADACTVLNSFAAVELASPDLDCDGLPDAVDPDDDMDAVADTIDNCPRVANPTQGDFDHDGLGDACDSDADNDGRPNLSDNCPLVANASQADFDHDGLGDACDDFDADGVVDAVDNCLATRNTDQADSDGDHIGNVCDTDLDNDGRLNANDNCPITANTSQADSDGDGIGDACDHCPVTADSGTDTDHDGLDNACDADDDNDGVADAGDNCPLVANASQADFNGNGIGTACDEKEQVHWQSQPVVFDGVLDRFIERHQVIELPIIPDPHDPRTCSPFGDGPAMQITIKAEFPFTGGVVDDRGRYVGFFDSAQGGSMQFQPVGDFCSLKLSPGKDGSFDGAFLGRSYFLEIEPGSDRAYPGAKFSVGVTARNPRASDR